MTVEQENRLRLRILELEAEVRRLKALVGEGE